MSSQHRPTGNLVRPGGTSTPASDLPDPIVGMSSNTYNHISATTGTSAHHLPFRSSANAGHTHNNHVNASGINFTTTGRQTRKSIYDRSLNRTRTGEVSRASFAYLFMEMVSYAQRRPKGGEDLEKTLNSLGYPIGIRMLDLLLYRTTSISTNTSSTIAPPTSRPTRILALLQFIHTTLWRHLFDRVADALEMSASSKSEYMITDTDQLVNRFISIPNEYSQLNCAAFVAGIIEGVCDGAGFPTEAVTAHWIKEDDRDRDRDGNGGVGGKVNIATVQGKTIFLIKFKNEALQREEMLEKK